MRAILISPRVSLRAALRQALDQSGAGLSIAAEAADAGQALNLLAMPKPDVAFVDADMPDSEAFTLMQTLYSAGIAFVVLSDTERHAFRAFELGALGYLLVPVEVEKVAETVRQVVKLIDPKPFEPPSFSEWLERRVSFRNQQDIFFVALKDLVRLEAKTNCTVAYAMGQNNGICMAKGYGSFAKTFDDVPFLYQPFRGHLINLYFVKRYNRADCVVFMPSNKGGEDIAIPVAKGCLEELIRRIEVLGWRE
jgi:two-component system, LytTR family, response regulator